MLGRLVRSGSLSAKPITIAARTPIGKFTKNTQRHDNLVGDEPADDRADHARQAPNPAKIRLHFRTLFKRESVADNGHSERYQSSGTETLDRSEYDQLRHRARNPGKQGP